MKYLEYKLKYLQFLNSNLTIEDKNFQIIEEFFQNEIEHLQEQQIPSIPQLQIQIKEFFNTKELSNSQTSEKDENFDAQNTETEKMKKVQNLKFIEYENELDLIDRNNLKPGNYYIKNGELVEGKPEIRSSALYSNWHAGNADPEDIRR